jgi:polar amino acid transport system substrate-binding protein
MSNPLANQDDLVIFPRHRRLRVLSLAFLIAVAASPALAQATADRAMTVGTKAAPPFAMQAENGTWTGLGLDLWRDMAKELGRPFTVKAYTSTQALIDAAARGEIDAGIAAVTITAEREQKIDFSHPFYRSGLGIAVSRERDSGVLDVLRALTSGPFLATLGTLLALLFATGAIIWVVEHRKNSGHFDKDPVSGIGQGFWWAAVTMTTVGYGDKVPITPLGRVIGVVWMFAALILTAVFTAQLASSFTVDRISGPVASANDLDRARVGVVDKSPAEDYLAQEFIRMTTYTDVNAGLAALARGDIDAFVHDAPILRYQILRDYRGRLAILPDVVEPQFYGIVLPPGSKDREAVNQALLHVLSSPEWATLNAKYLGKTDE